MSKNKWRGYIILAVLWAVFSVVAFSVPFVKTPVFWLAYVFAVIAIVYQIYVFRISFGDGGSVQSKLYGFPIARVGVIYLIVQLLVSLAEMVLAAFIPAWAVVILNVLPIAFAVVGCIAADIVRDEIARQDTQLKRDVSNMRALQSMSAALVGQCNDADLKETMQNVADEFQFSDPVSSEQTKDLEQELQNQMNEIQKALVDSDLTAVKVLCGKILGSLAERNRICALNK